MKTSLIHFNNYRRISGVHYKYLTLLLRILHLRCWVCVCVCVCAIYCFYIRYEISWICWQKGQSNCEPSIHSIRVITQFQSVSSNGARRSRVHPPLKKWRKTEKKKRAEGLNVVVLRNTFEIAPESLWKYIYPWWASKTQGQLCQQYTLEIDETSLMDVMDVMNVYVRACTDIYTHTHTHTHT